MSNIQLMFIRKPCQYQRTGNRADDTLGLIFHQPNDNYYNVDIQFLTLFAVYYDNFSNQDS